jgi:hypothetical protein
MRRRPERRIGPAPRPGNLATTKTSHVEARGDEPWVGTVGTVLVAFLFLIGLWTVKSRFDTQLKAESAAAMEQCNITLQ